MLPFRQMTLVMGQSIELEEYENEKERKERKERGVKMFKVNVLTVFVY